MVLLFFMNTVPTETYPESFTFTTVEAYQAWAATDWLFVLGSDAAQTHVRAKFNEEVDELVVALSDNDEEGILGELGDVLWTATGCAFNSGTGLEESIRHELSSEFFEDGPLTTSQIDRIALEVIPDVPTDAMADWLLYLSRYLGKASKQWLRLGHLVDLEEDPQSFSDTLIRTKLARTYNGLTQTFLICSAISQRRLGKTIEEIMVHNAQKLSTRKSHGLPITKSPRLPKH